MNPRGLKVLRPGMSLAAAFLALAIASVGLAQRPATVQITIDPGQRFQTIDGFGVNFNGTHFRDAQKAMMDMLIDDLGATIFRLDPYGQTNWEVVNDNDDPNVINWEYFNDRYSSPPFEASWAAARHLNSRGIRPLLNLSGTVPGWILDDKAPPPKHSVCNDAPNVLHPQTGKPPHLNPAMYEEFAELVVSMAVYARTKARIQFDYLSPFNETDCYPVEGPRIDPEEAPKVLEAIARRLVKEGLGDVKLVVAEQANVNNDYFGPIADKAPLMKQVGVLALHTYSETSVGAQAERIRQSKYPHLPIWLTEYGDLNDLDRSAENDWKSFSLTAMRRALRALNQGASAALFWDAFDNYQEHDLRITYYALVRNSDHLYAPKKRYFAAKQLYHFVRPGSKRIAATADAPELMVSAFRDASANSLTVVGVKQGGPSHIQVTLPISDPMPQVWELYMTTRNLDCHKVDNAAIRGGSAEFDLPDEAVFTLMGVLKPAD